eukprot:scaffold6110_cov118-Isochrysis_galbana.AAC.4
MLGSIWNCIFLGSGSGAPLTPFAGMWYAIIESLSALSALGHCGGSLPVSSSVAVIVCVFCFAECCCRDSNTSSPRRRFISGQSILPFISSKITRRLPCMYCGHDIGLSPALSGVSFRLFIDSVVTRSSNTMRRILISTVLPLAPSP